MRIKSVTIINGYGSNHLKSRELLKKLITGEDDLALSLVTGCKAPIKLFGTQIANDIIPYMYDIFKRNSSKKTLRLFLRSNGGALEAPLPIVNLIREFYDKFVVYVSEHAHSAATLISLGADEIIMGPMGSLSPVDPQIKFPNQKDITMGAFSVEDVAGYYQLIDKLDIPDAGRVEALRYMVEKLPPTLLGQIERVRGLIRMVAGRLMQSTSIDETKKEMIIKRLTEEYPSHQYQISRVEVEEMGLKVKKADDQIQVVLDDLLDEYQKMLAENEHELVVNVPDGQDTLERDYERAFLETVDYGYSFVTKYVFHRNGKVDQSINEWRRKDED